MLCMASVDPRARLVESLLAKHQLSNRWLAERIGRSHPSVNDWLSGDRAPKNRQVFEEMLQAIRSFEDSISPDREKQVRKMGIRLIPLYNGISAGMLSSIQSDVDYIEVMDWGNGFDRWARTVMGFSMSPLLEPGDIVVFESRPAEPGHVVHAFDAGEDTIKVLRGRGASARLVPVNPEYEEISGAGMNIKGVAMEVHRKLSGDATQILKYDSGLRWRATE